MIQLFDRYGQESRDLHESLEVAGLSHVTVVIEPDGFSPRWDSFSFTYYLGYESGKALYFNQVAVPEFWEIAGNNQSAHILGGFGRGGDSICGCSSGPFGQASRLEGPIRSHLPSRSL